MMRKSFKRFVSFFLIPATRWYLRKDRRYTYKGVAITVFHGVFHPGLFYSTKFLLDFLLDQPLKDRKLLELGGGSGLISIHCAKQGATVTVTDLSQKALSNIEFNGKQNQVSFDLVYSDMFNALPSQRFDWIVINPPYYAGEPKNEADLAWYCGKDFDYFRKLFSGLAHYRHAETRVIMVLTLGCDLEKIFSVARLHGFEFKLIKEQDVLFDGKDFLFEIRPKTAG